VRVPVSIRVQRWVKDWLEATYPDQSGEAVEDALKRVHKIEPPE